MTKNNKNFNSPEDKVEIAKKIASKSQKVTDSYVTFEDNLFRFFKWFSSLIDNFIFNRRYGAIVALGLAIMLYFSVNYNSENSIFSQRLSSAKSIEKVSINARYNSESFEISGVPESCDITILGDAASVNNAAIKKGYCLINLDGYVEGTHNVKLVPVGYGDNVNVKVSPSDVNVSLKKKTTGQFIVGYDFINTDKLDSKYNLNPPVFENNKVNIRASQDTLNSIAFVKALIDVNGVSGDFSKEANLVAYNKNGLPVNADIVPNKVTVTVKVSSPRKVVPVILETTGEVPNNKAIDSIFMDHQTVTIYAPEAVLADINHVLVKVDASTLTKDTKIVQPISLPSKVLSSNITKVNLEIKLADKEEKVMNDIPILFENYDNNFALKVLNDQTNVSVKVYGTKNNIDEIQKSDINVYFDLKNLTEGSYDLPLQISKSPNPYVTFVLQQKTINVTLNKGNGQSN